MSFFSPTRNCKVFQITGIANEADNSRLGVGAIAAGKSSNGAVRKEATALDLLRRQILGKKAGSTASNPSKSFGQASLAQRTTTKTSVHSPATIDAPSEDEEGRATAVFAKVRARSESSKGTKFSEDRISIKTQCRQEVDDDVDNMNLEVKPRLDNSAKASPANSASTKRKSANFLDEILAEKANRKKRRKKKHNEDIDKEAIA